MRVFCNMRNRKVYGAKAIVGAGLLPETREVRYIIEQDEFEANRRFKWIARIEFPDGLPAVDVGPVLGRLPGHFRTATDALNAAKALRPPVDSRAAVADDAFHLLQDAAEKFAAGGLQGKADEVYRLIERLADRPFVGHRTPQ
jgi:hypothetical protein